MDAYLCTVCGFLYDEESAEKTPEGQLIPLKELDFEWGCPVCGGKGDTFEKTTSTRTKDVPVEETKETKE